MALTEINSKSIKDGEIVNADIADDTIAEAKLDISNTASDGQYLQYKDSTDKLTWATVSTDLVADTSPQLGGDLDTNDFEITLDDAHAVKFGADNDLIIKEDSGAGFITARTGGVIYLGAGSSSNMLNVNGTQVNILGETRLYNGNDLTVSGSGNIIIEEHATDATNGSLRFRERAANGSAYVGIKGPLDMGAASSYTVTLPTATPTTGQVLKSSSTATTLEWGEAGAGATGGGTEKIFWENGTTIDTDYTVGTSFGAACNAMSAGPITINTGKTVTVDAGDTWTIV